MNYYTKLNPNILLTNICNQSCKYCFAKNEMESAAKKEMGLKDLCRLVDILKKERINEVRLMGGEPTLHSQFKEIVNFILSQNLKIRLFTNGLFSSELANWLGAKEKDSIWYIINLTTSAFDSESGRKKIGNNLNILKNFNITASITLNNLDFKNDALVKFIEEYQIKFVRLGVANNLISDSNWLKFGQYKNFGSAICLLVDKLKGTDVSEISLNCGFTPCMFQPEQISFLKREAEIIGWGCRGKRAPFDISAELKIFPCFILEDLNVKNIFKFKNLRLAKIFFENLIHYALRDSFVFEPCGKCAYFEKLECAGPCFGWLINASNKQKAFADFPKTLYFKIIRNLLYLSRNWV